MPSVQALYTTASPHPSGCTIPARPPAGQEAAAMNPHDLICPKALPELIQQS